MKAYRGKIHAAHIAEAAILLDMNRRLHPLIPTTSVTMVEFIGAAAAALQLARYSVSAANAVPDFARRVRKAPVTQDRWTDQATLLTTTSQQAYQHINGSTALSPIINRLTEHLECVRSQLHQTALDTDDGKIARLRKKIRVVRRENELDKEIQAISQQIMLCSQFATLSACSLGLAEMMLTVLGFIAWRTHPLLVVSFPQSQAVH